MSLKMAGGAGILLIFAGQAAAQAEPSVKPIYSVAPIQFTIPIGQKVGVKRAGMLCLPNGGLYWSRPVNAGAAQILIAGALRRTGMAVADPVDLVFGDPEPVTPFRVVARVSGGHLSLCQPSWGALGIIPGNRMKVKGRGYLTVHWELWSREQRQMILSRDLSVEADLSGEGGSDGAFDAALSASALAFGEVLTKATPDKAVAQP